MLRLDLRMLKVQLNSAQIETTLEQRSDDVKQAVAYQVYQPRHTQPGDRLHYGADAWTSDCCGMASALAATANGRSASSHAVNT